MSIRYYPVSKIKPNKKSDGTKFLLNGEPYRGKYYETFDGEFFTGANPIVGKNEKLTIASTYMNQAGSDLPKSVRDKLNRNKRNPNQTQSVENGDIRNIKQFALPTPNFKGSPTTYFPIPIESDYQKGYLTRYFVKRTNSNGYITEISQEEYAAIKNGEVPYDVTFWQAIEIFWKLTGPLNTKRVSQYQTRAGIIDTNKRLIEQADKTFLGIKEFIAEKYDKFARPTE